jgi:hypothetical protein
VVGDDGFRFAAATSGRHGDRCCRSGGRRGLHGVDGIVSDARDHRRGDGVHGVVTCDFRGSFGIAAAAHGCVSVFLGVVVGFGRGVGFR